MLQEHGKKTKKTIFLKPCVTDRRENCRQKTNKTKKKIQKNKPKCTILTSTIKGSLISLLQKKKMFHDGVFTPKPHRECSRFINTQCQLIRCCPKKRVELYTENTSALLDSNPGQDLFERWMDPSLRENLTLQQSSR